jgi:hypothetical protein
MIAPGQVNALPVIRAQAAPGAIPAFNCSPWKNTSLAERGQLGLAQ